MAVPWYGGRSVYCRKRGEIIQSQRPLGEPRIDMIPSNVRREGKQLQQPKGEKVKKRLVTKMSGLYMEEPLCEGQPSSG